MKNILLFFAFVVISISVSAQRGGNADKIKALKTAYITSTLDLTPKEAQDFWPVYNQYDKRIFKAKILKTRELMKRIRNAGGIEELSDSEADKILEEFINIDFNVANAKQELRKNLKNIIPGKKIVKLFRAEQDFNKKLLKEFRNKRKNMQGRTRN